MKNNQPHGFTPVIAVFWAAATMLFSVCAVAGLPPETRWADPVSVRLDVEFPGTGYHANWKLFRCDCGDLLVRSELSIPGEVEKGETMLVGGRVVLSRGFGEDQAELGSSLDAPALMMQLALRLLERSLPAGPSMLNGLENVSVEDLIGPIHLDTGTAAGSFFAPWNVQGTVESVGESQRRFDLQFRFSTGNPGEELVGSMRLSGLAEFAGLAFPYPPSTSLQGWQLNWRDEADPAAAESAGSETLGELRVRLQIKDQN